MSDTYEQVEADLRGRQQKGVETYGATLDSTTPNDHLRYAYEEVLDQAVYMRAEIARRDEAIKRVQEMKNKLEREIDLCGLGDRPMSPPSLVLETDLMLAEVLDLLDPGCKIVSSR